MSLFEGTISTTPKIAVADLCAQYPIYNNYFRVTITPPNEPITVNIYKDTAIGILLDDLSVRVYDKANTITRLLLREFRVTIEGTSREEIEHNLVAMENKLFKQLLIGVLTSGKAADFVKLNPEPKIIGERYIKNYQLMDFHSPPEEYAFLPRRQVLIVDGCMVLYNLREELITQEIIDQSVEHML